MLKSLLNKENTPKKQQNSSKTRRIFVDDTPTPKQRVKKVLVSRLNNLEIPDTPGNSQEIKQTKQIRKLFNPNQFRDDDLPGIDGEQSNIFITKRNDRSENVRSIFKPKLKQNRNGERSIDISNGGCNDSLETLQRRENSRNRKVVRLSEVLSELELNEDKNEQVTSTQNNHTFLVTTPKTNHNIVSLIQQTPNTCSFTHVTNDECKTSFNSTTDLSITVYTGNVSLIKTFQKQQYTAQNFSIENFTDTNISINDDSSKTHTFDVIVPDTEDDKIKGNSRESNDIHACQHLFIPDTNPNQIPSSKCDYFNENNVNNETTRVEETTESAIVNYDDVCESNNDETDCVDDYSDHQNVENDEIVDNEEDEITVENIPLVGSLNCIHSRYNKLQLTYTNLTKMQLKLLKKIVKTNFHKNTIIERRFDIKTTHLIIGNHVSKSLNTQINAKILLAIVNNCKLVKFDWILKSSNEKEWLYERDFIYDDYKLVIDKYRKTQKPFQIFSQYKNIYICLNIKDNERDYFYELIIKCNGHITSRPNRATLILCNNSQCSHFVDIKKIFKNKSVPIVSVNWIYDCVLNMKNLCFNKYLLSYTTNTI